MESLYSRAEIYDLFENEQRYEAYRKHWETVFKDRDIRSMLDVSIGSGSVTLPVTELGVKLSGSDLSSDMLKNCEEKASARGVGVTLKKSDFRSLECWGDELFDIVASTGNSLGYVDNADVERTLEEMDRHVRPGGYLYFDSRNWEKILAEHQRFYTYNPLFVEDNRVNVVQCWDYNDDGTMVFNILYTFERDNRVFQKEIFEEHYNPFPKALAVDKLRALDYTDIELKGFPAQFPPTEFEKLEWYSVIAKKSEKSLDR
ncbi:MAG: class I SAM-dependent methyltransferase [Lachnospiraceae bacterium]|nr:class I SAM-dependent methyltransferase [Lachnospiraceae bacterium]